MDLPPEKIAMGEEMSNKIGALALEQLDALRPLKPVIDTHGLTYKAKSEDNAIPDPPNAKFRVALVGCYVDSHPMGGSAKVTSGHRFDSVGIANGLRRAGIAVQMIFY